MLMVGNADDCLPAAAAELLLALLTFAAVLCLFKHKLCYDFWF
jgi:hypothetical protein